MNLTTEYINKMLTNLPKLEPNKWFKIDGRPDATELTEVLKHLIDSGNSYLFSHDYKMFKIEKCVVSDFKTIPHPKLHETLKGDPNYQIEEIPRGFTETWTQDVAKKGRQTFTHTFQKTHYRIYRGDKLIAIE